MVKCLILLKLLLNSLAEDPQLEERILVCQDIMAHADHQEVDISLALAVAWRESNWTFQFKNNGSSCYGPFQIKAKYWCLPEKGEWTPSNTKGRVEGCDLVARGIFSLKYYLKKYKNPKKALCAYAGADLGKCDSNSYVEYTLRIQKRIQKRLLSTK